MAYKTVQPFAYPGWRLTVPGGPAGGQYKGFTHTQSAGTDLLPQDQYEQDREDGMSSHDAAHASVLNPRGVYRSSAEVPPRPNASGAAQTYRGFQVKHHAGQSVSPGSFPASFFTTAEDILSTLLGDATVYPVERGSATVLPALPFPPAKPIAILAPAPGVATFAAPAPPATGATSVVAQPGPTAFPLPPAPVAQVPSLYPPISPTPGPIVATNEVIPLNDGSGNYLNVSTGQIVPASAVTINPATGQLTAGSSALSWLEGNTIFSSFPNWVVLGGGVLVAALLFGGGSRIAAGRR